MAYGKKDKKTFVANMVEIISLLAIVFLIRTFGFGLYQVPTGSMETSMLVGERFFADKLSYIFRDPERLEIIAFNDPTYNYSENTLTNLFERYAWGPMNLTKRIIGKPGDEIRGTIEDGKPIIYRNGVKIDEPYLNKYPLVHVWLDDPSTVQRNAQQKFQTLIAQGLNLAKAEAVINYELSQSVAIRSYDPNVSFNNQPFYRMQENRIERNQDGTLALLWPATPIYSKKDNTQPDTNQNYWDGSDEFSVKLGSNEYWLMGDNREGSKDSRFFGPVSRNLIHGRILFRIWSLDGNDPWFILDLIKHPIDFWSRIRWNRFFQWVT